MTSPNTFKLPEPIPHIGVERTDDWCIRNMRLAVKAYAASLPDLHGAIMNLQADGAMLDWANTREAYLYGHRDARHAAAELALSVFCAASMQGTEPRWYCVSRIGMTTLCSDKADAIREAASSDKMFPNNAPHHAAQLVEMRAPNEPAQDILEAETPEPFAYFVYVPSMQSGEFVHDLDAATETLANNECEIVELFNRPPPAAGSDELVEALQKLLGSAGDPNNGWRGAGSREEYQCEYCGAKHADCTAIPHSPSCPIPFARDALARHLSTQTGETR